MKKYEDVENDVVELFEKVVDEYHFNNVADARFKLVYRNKKKGSRNFITIAEICSTSEMVRFLTSKEVEDGYDYIIIIDKNIWEALDEKDRIRVLRHELRHCDVVVNDKTGTITYGTRKHTVEDFYEDIEIEAQPDGDSRWKERISATAESIYEAIEEEEKEKKKKNKKKKGF